MENWGLITYRETSILYDRSESSSAAHQWVAVVVAHELAHQWLGNLVTMTWWTHLWLSEGFASFIEYVGVDYIRPEWKMMEQFVLEKTQPALKLDALLGSSHPIFVEVKDPRSIESIFDTISYNKGAAILRMLESVIGEEHFRRGLMIYLNEHKFSSAKTDDLWNALSLSSNGSAEVKTIMEAWTSLIGFPLIRVRLENRTAKVSQEPFRLGNYSTPSNNTTEDIEHHSTVKYEDPENLWYVPLSYVTDVAPRSSQLTWLNKTQYYEFPMPFHAQWIKFNINQTGFYRVLYEGELWQYLVNVLLSNPFVFTPTDRANLIDDAFSLSKAGLISAEIPLELSQYLIKETDYVPWATALEHFRSWSQILYEKPAHRLLLQFMLKLIDPIYRNVGWSDSGSHLMKLLRGDVLSAAIHADNKEAVKEARNRFNSWMEKGARVPPNLREVVYSTGVKYGGVAAWDHCWAAYNKTDVPSEKKLLLKAIGTASDPWLLQQYLSNCLDKDSVRSQDIRTVLAVVAANPNGRLLAWRHLRIHWDELERVFGQGSFTMGSLITAVVSHFASEFDYVEVQNFFTDRDVGSGKRALTQSLEIVDLNIHWLENNEKTIQGWLQNHLK